MLFCAPQMFQRVAWEVVPGFTSEFRDLHGSCMLLAKNAWQSYGICLGSVGEVSGICMGMGWEMYETCMGMYRNGIKIA